MIRLNSIAYKVLKLYKEGYRGFIIKVYSTKALYYIFNSTKGPINKATFGLDIIEEYNIATNRKLDYIIEVTSLFNRGSLSISISIGGSKCKDRLIEVLETAIIILLYLALSK